MRVLVNGIGNVGTTLISALIRYQNLLKIEKIYACKRTLNPWSRPELNILCEQGVEVCALDESSDYRPYQEVISQVEYIFETTANGVGLCNQKRYESLPGLIGACAQGSEKGFGPSFMSGVNESLITGQKLVHIVSCNTHGTAALLRLFCGEQLENLRRADMVVVRRSEDIGSHQRLVSGNVVARHLSASAGTHHSVDVIDMFEMAGIACPLTSSDITTPSQLLHSVRFEIETLEQKPIDLDSQAARYPLIALTQKFDSNAVFELGRRYGFHGRLFSHAIVVSSNILYSQNSVRGWAFVPQEGNTIISSIHAYLLQTKHPKAKEVVAEIIADLCRREW